MARRCISAAFLVMCVATTSRAQAQDEPVPNKTSEEVPKPQVEPAVPAPAPAAVQGPAVATKRTSPELSSKMYEPAPRRFKSEWYGGYILGVDAVGLATTPIGVGFGIYVLGGPIVHLVKHEPVAALGSLGLRVGMPLLLGTGGLLVGAYACDESDSHDNLGCPFGAAFGGAIIGALGAIAIDAAVLARHEIPVAPTTKTGITYAPSVVVARDRAMVTMGGTF